MCAECINGTDVAEKLILGSGLDGEGEYDEETLMMMAEQVCYMF